MYKAGGLYFVNCKNGVHSNPIAIGCRPSTKRYYGTKRGRYILVYPPIVSEERVMGRIKLKSK